MKHWRPKREAGEKLRSEEGHALMVRRMTETETVFGDIKSNRGVNRFLLRGLPKVSPEAGWLSLAHNMLKKPAIDAKNQGAKRKQSAQLPGRFRTSFVIYTEVVPKGAFGTAPFSLPIQYLSTIHGPKESCAGRNAAL